MTQMRNKDLCDKLERIARKAGDIIMDYYHNGTEAMIKADKSVVTKADQDAEAYVTQALQKLTPNIPILGEESTAAGKKTDISGGTFWAIDPLDGTSEFVNKSKGFAVLIGLVEDHKPTIGVVYHPALDLMYSAHGPNTAKRTNPDGSIDELSTENKAKDGRVHMVLNANYADIKAVFNELSKDSRAKGQKEEFRVHGEKVTHIRQSHPIYKFALVAEGATQHHMHVSKRKGDGTNIWDIVAGHALLNGAGGSIVGFDKKPILYGKNTLDNYRVQPFIASHQSEQQLRKFYKSEGFKR